MEKNQMTTILLLILIGLGVIYLGTKDRGIKMCKAVPVSTETMKNYWTGEEEEESLGKVDFPESRMKLGSECAGKNAAFVSSDLLPKVKNEMQEYAPELKGMNLLDADEMIGIDTVGNTLKNANYSLRSEPPNPRKIVSPWMNTSIEPDPYRKPLEM